MVRSFPKCNVPHVAHHNIFRHVRRTIEYHVLVTPSVKSLHRLLRFLFNLAATAKLSFLLTLSGLDITLVALSVIFKSFKENDIKDPRTVNKIIQIISWINIKIL